MELLQVLLLMSRPCLIYNSLNPDILIKAMAPFPFEFKCWVGVIFFA